MHLWQQFFFSEELGRTDVVKNKMYTDSTPP